MELMNLWTKLKIAMGILPTNTTLDAKLQLWITEVSDVISTLCNRVFAYEGVTERWACVTYDQTNTMKRLFVSHYPIDPATQVTVEISGVSLVADTDYIIEEKSGKIELLTSQSEPVTVSYFGGYELPDGCPPALKMACELMVRQQQALYNRLSISGVRSVTHKDSRVMYFDPLALPGGFKLGDAANNLLMHYVRLEV